MGLIPFHERFALWTDRETSREGVPEPAFVRCMEDRHQTPRSRNEANRDTTIVSSWRVAGRFLGLDQREWQSGASAVAAVDPAMPAQMSATSN
jgi:hypothetical protein